MNNMMCITINVIGSDFIEVKLQYCKTVEIFTFSPFPSVRRLVRRTLLCRLSNFYEIIFSSNLQMRFRDRYSYYRY